MNRIQNKTTRNFLTATLVLACSVGTFASLPAQEQASMTAVSVDLSKKGPRGGALMKLGDGYGELLATPYGARLYLYTREGRLMVVENERAQIAVSTPGERKRRWYGLYPERHPQSGESCLQVDIDLTEISFDSLSSMVYLQSGKNPSSVQQLACDIPIRRSVDETALLEQQVCPVSQKELRLRSQYVKQVIEGKPVFFCCSECIEGYAAISSQNALGTPDPVKAAKADAAGIALQRLCPVMEEPLDAMGGPWKIMVQGKPVFVCCKGCIESVQDEPEEYLARTQELTEQTKRR